MQYVLVKMIVLTMYSTVVLKIHQFYVNFGLLFSFLVLSKIRISTYFCTLETDIKIKREDGEKKRFSQIKI